MMTARMLYHLFRSMVVLSVAQSAPRKMALQTYKGQQFHSGSSASQFASLESWSAQETSDERYRRDHVERSLTGRITGAMGLSEAGFEVPRKNLVRRSTNYDGRKRFKNEAIRASTKDARRLKNGRAGCILQQSSIGNVRKRTGGVECEQEEGVLSTQPHLAQQDMSNDPAFQEMPNTVGPNPNIFGGFPENDIWGNFELPSAETIDHLKLALKMNRHRPSYSEDQASDANDQLYSYEHHALPEYDILETPPFQHLLWQNAQLQQVMKAGGNGCPPGMGSCPPTNNQITCENLNEVCAANAQHKPVDQPEYEAPCPDKILQLFGCGAPTKAPPQEKVEEEEAIPVKPPKKKKPKKPAKEKDDKEKKPTPIPLQITSEGGAKELGQEAITSDAKVKEALAFKELTDDIRQVVDQERTKLSDNENGGADQIMTPSSNQLHEKQLISENVQSKAFHPDEKINDHSESGNSFMGQKSSRDGQHALHVTAALTHAKGESQNEDTKPDKGMAKISSPTDHEGVLEPNNKLGLMASFNALNGKGATTEGEFDLVHDHTNAAENDKDSQSLPYADNSAKVTLADKYRLWKNFTSLPSMFDQEGAERRRKSRAVNLSDSLVTL